MKKLFIYIYIQSTDFSSKWENNDSKNDAIKMRKIIYTYIHIYLIIKSIVPKIKNIIWRTHKFSTRPVKTFLT